MQQYIYGNIGHKDYAYVSSEPEFFSNAQRAAVLSHLMSYDVFCKHGDLATSAHQSFWMVVSNLDNPSAPDRLYLQASGGDPHRTGFYVRGYMSDREDGYLYDSRLLSLLRSQFTGFEQTMAEAEAGNLKPVSLEEIPLQPDLRSASLDPELLRVVLLALMRKKKVIIRIPAVGAEAMKLSREYILAIYERLPFEQRKVNGFVTGISAGKLNDKNTLPASVTLMLMDGDADLGGLTSDMFQEVCDLANPMAKFRPMPRESKGKKLPYVDLMDFLAQQSAEELDAFFRFCRSCMRDDVDGSSLGIQDYSMYLNFFNIGRSTFTDDSIRNWAANIYVNARKNEKWTADVKRALYERICATLPVSQLEDYLCRAAEDYDALKTFGLLAEDELKRSADAEAAVRDQNAALTLAMAEALMKHYPEGTRERLVQALYSRFVTLACQQHPCLTEEYPTAKTIADLAAIRMPEELKKTPPIVNAIKELVCAELERRRSAVTRIYEQEYKAQCMTGLGLIGSWPERPRETLTALYDRLRELYLFPELIAAGSDSGWNDAIARRISDLCMAAEPQVLEDYELLLAQLTERCETFAAFGGVLPEDRSKTIGGAKAEWSHILALGNQDCAQVEQLLELFRQISESSMPAPLAGSLKKRYTDSLCSRGVTREQILKNGKAICEASMDPYRLVLLKQVVAACPELTVLPQMPAEKLEVCLKIFARREQAGLVDAPVVFQPWNARGSAKTLLSRLAALEGYTTGAAAPELKDKRIRDWAAENLRSNTDLMFLLAKNHSGYRQSLIPELAQRSAGVTKEQLRALYVSGCSKSMLCRGAGEKTSEQWKRCLEEVFPGWVELPEPVHLTLPSGLEGMKLLLIAHAVLLALAGVVPAAAMLMLDACSDIVCMAVLAVLVVAALLLMAISFIGGKKAQKLFMRVMAAAMVPGIVATIVCLVMNLK